MSREVHQWRHIPDPRTGLISYNLEKCTLCRLERKLSARQNKWLVPYGYSHNYCGEPKLIGNRWTFHLVQINGKV